MGHIDVQGQTKPVQIERLIMQGTVEQHILDMSVRPSVLYNNRLD